jgi:predicted component of type VI protein secretion system
MNSFRFFLLIAAVACVFAGCATTEPDNASERPWNVQQGWQHGLPSTINQGR